ncbi:MAG: HesA/MoeB/ThiF family protein [Candidatus Promineifilaceae bacterium]
MSEPIIITDPESDRYHAFGYISWWRQEVVRGATALVVGAGALGNEVLKNLALMGLGQIIVADFDTIEDSNLSRSVLFRANHNGGRKAEVAAQSVRELNPDVRVRAWHGDINFDMGLGVFRHVDVVIGCLDNREARLSLNRFCWAVGRPWVDGAIQELMGIVRVFWPGRGACYECTLTDLDYQLINLRYSCPLLARENIQLGKVPTTPTSASIVAAFQTQEALKLLHGLEVNPGHGLIINGLTNDIYTTKYPVKPDCLSHSLIEPICELEHVCASQTTAADLLRLARERLGPETTLELGFELVTALICTACGRQTQPLKRMARLTERELDCPECAGRREMELSHRFSGDELFLERPLSDLDLPALSILRARNGGDSIYLELTGDKEQFFSYN